MIRTQVIGDKALIAKLNAAQARLEGLKPYWMHDAGEVVRASIETNILEQGLIRTGELGRSGRVFYQTKNGVSVGFGKGLDYAEPLELGSRPHVIYARNPLEKMLYFWWERENRYFYGPAVMHPGNRPYRYVYQGTMDAMPALIVLFKEYLRAVFKVPM